MLIITHANVRATLYAGPQDGRELVTSPYTTDIITEDGQSYVYDELMSELRHRPIYTWSLHTIPHV